MKSVKITLNHPPPTLFFFYFEGFPYISLLYKWDGVTIVMTGLTRSLQSATILSGSHFIQYILVLCQYSSLIVPPSHSQQKQYSEYFTKRMQMDWKTQTESVWTFFADKVGIYQYLFCWSIFLQPASSLSTPR